MKNEKDKNRDAREWISKAVVYSVLIGSALIGVLLLVDQLFISKNEDNLHFIGQSLLPVWGTWVGTVLAFYFGKSNFDAASESYQKVIKTLSSDEKIASVNTLDVMIPFDEIVKLFYDESKDITIKDILNMDSFKKRNRYAIFNYDKTLKYIIHRSEFTKYIASKAFDKVDVDKITLDEFIKEGEKSENIWFYCACFVPVGANLLEAKNAMAGHCQDVFITKAGKANEPVMGLITNTMILEHAQSMV